VRNPRCVALAAVAAALLASARATAGVRSSWFPLATRLLAGAGHTAVLTLLLGEAANAIADDAHLLVVATLILGGHAVALLVLGFAARSAFHRYLGLGLFAVTLAKLALVDVWTLARAYQTVVFLGVGALLVAAGFLYARFGRRLLALLRDGDL
jgi:purine-cytosine permease-like protein